MEFSILLNTLGGDNEHYPLFIIINLRHNLLIMRHNEVLKHIKISRCGVCYARYLRESDNMKEIFLRIQSMSQQRIRTLKVVMILCMIFEAIWIFPLEYEFSIFNAVIIYCFFMVGFILGVVTVRKAVVILLGIIFSNFAGLALRVWLEWGEVTITQGLTPKSVFLTYVPVIIVTYIGYVYAKRKIE